MFLISQISNQNKLAGVQPLEKCVFGIGTLVTGLIFASIPVFLLISLLMIPVILIYTGISLKMFIKLLILPLSFIIMGLAAIIIVVHTDPVSGYTLFTVNDLHIGITRASAIKSLRLFIQATSAVLCFYFFILSTPISEIEHLMEKLQLPSVFRDLVILMYRFIFIFYTITQQIYITQRSRLGYSSIKTAYQSLANLLASLFVRSYTLSHQSYLALLSRGYNGKLHVMNSEFKTSGWNWFIIIFVQLLVVLVYYTDKFWL